MLTAETEAEQEFRLEAAHACKYEIAKTLWCAPPPPLSTFSVSLVSVQINEKQLIVDNGQWKC